MSFCLNCASLICLWIQHALQVSSCTWSLSAFLSLSLLQNKQTSWRVIYLNHSGEYSRCLLSFPPSRPKISSKRGTTTVPSTTNPRQTRHPATYIRLGAQKGETNWSQAGPVARLPALNYFRPSSGAFGASEVVIIEPSEGASGAGQPDRGQNLISRLSRALCWSGLRMSQCRRSFRFVGQIIWGQASCRRLQANRERERYENHLCNFRYLAAGLQGQMEGDLEASDVSRVKQSLPAK